jgi:hypothetical protein
VLQVCTHRCCTLLSLPSCCLLCLGALGSPWQHIRATQHAQHAARHMGGKLVIRKVPQVVPDLLSNWLEDL